MVCVLSCVSPRVVAHRSRAIARCSHVVARIILRVNRAMFARRHQSFARSGRASGSLVAHIPRVDHVCRTTCVRNNKLFSLINTHVNNVNSSCHIF